MIAKHLPLVEVDDGDLVLVNWPQRLNYGIKVSAADQNFVCVLQPNIHDIQGPLVWAFNEEELVVTFGPEWHVNFDPANIAYPQGNRPPLGSLLVTNAGLAIVCHGQEIGNACISVSDGEITVPVWHQPIVCDWRLLVRMVGDEFREVLSWPPA